MLSFDLLLAGTDYKTACTDISKYVEQVVLVFSHDMYDYCAVCEYLHVYCNCPNVIFAVLRAPNAVPQSIAAR